MNRTVVRAIPRAALCSIGLLTHACYAHARRDEPKAPPAPVADEMVSVPAGTFTMGDLNGEPDEYPERTVELGAFRIDRTEVSNAAYRACVSAKACDATPYLEDTVFGRDDHPVVGATWADALAFCKWRAKRLPTEAEWEYAAKGTDHRKWPWSGAFDAARVNAARGRDAPRQTESVLEHPGGASPFGAVNMAGNVAEWVADYFDPTYYRTSTNHRDPRGPERGRERVVRGGSYLDPSHLVRVSARRGKLATETDNTIGIRCAADAG